jgi:hypothetical protein
MDDSQDQLAQGEYGLEEEEDDDGEELTEEQGKITNYCAIF